MKKTAFSMAMLVTLLLLGSRTADAKKKPEEPVQESFRANIEGMTGSPYLTIAIQEFSTDDEAQQFAQSYARGGDDSLRKAMDKSKKGYFTLGSSQTVRLRVIRAEALGTGRRLLLVGDVPDTFYPGESPDASSGAVMGPRMVMVGHAGYSVIQLEVDAQGNGKGIMYTGCKVSFNAHGQLVLLPPTGSSPMTVAQAARLRHQLVNVHLEK